MKKQLFLCLAALCFLSQIEAKKFSMKLDRGDGNLKDVEVSVNIGQKTVSYTVDDDDNYDGIDCMEDYKQGVGASRIDEERCIVKSLPGTFKDQLAYLREQDGQVVSLPEKTPFDIVPVEEEELQSLLGKKLVKHCGDLPVYKVVTLVDEDGNKVSRDLEEYKRQFSLSFTKCCFFLFFGCVTTTITLPTGLSLIFFLFG